jgi:glycosyltransferase involved in cell wall biosynthesis
VELLGRREHAEVRELLERAAVLAMPSVIAADGDRDSMPVVVKEALAMEVPVVASDEVGLPEVVRPEFGRLVPPGDAAALAAAVAELLALQAAERAAMGRAGREFVKGMADSRAEAARLSELLSAAPPA